MRAGVVLGLDTATRATAIGVLAGEVAVEAWDDPPSGQRPAHASALLPLAAKLLTDAGLAWGDVERIAVGVGPGSFTGLRIGVASARAVAQSTGATLTGVSTLRALALPAAQVASGRRVLALVEGGRGEVFAGGWHGENEVIAPQPMPRAALGGIVQSAGGEWLAVGEPAPGLRDELGPMGVEVPPDDSPLHRVSGLALCRVEPTATGRDNVVPDYLRLPDAEIRRRERSAS
jgi:tRNA threonylcarbamoyladenosine biosynthesis protein TsaB